MLSQQQKTKKSFKQLPKNQQMAVLAKYKNMPEYAEGLADLQKAYLYSKKKQQEEKDYQESLRPNKNQTTLLETQDRIWIKGDKEFRNTVRTILNTPEGQELTKSLYQNKMGNKNNKLSIKKDVNLLNLSSHMKNVSVAQKRDLVSEHFTTMGTYNPSGDKSGHHEVLIKSAAQDMGKSKIASTTIHELTHVNEARTLGTEKMSEYHDLPYENRPHEVRARENQMNFKNPYK